MLSHHEIKKDHLYIRITGSFEPQAAQADVLAIIETARREKQSRVLCDLTSVSGFEADLDQTMARFSLAKFVGDILPRDLKVAFLQTREQIEPDRFDEHAMLNRGALVKITSDLQEALGWLAKETGPCGVSQRFPRSAQSA